jgi:hypothetical protein
MDKPMKRPKRKPLNPPGLTYSEQKRARKALKRAGYADVPFNPFHGVTRRFW